MYNKENIKLQEVSFSYERKQNVINKINIDVEKGDVFAIVGASGSGKSTILRIISDILGNKDGNKMEGEISIFGQKPHNYRKAGKLSFMFQSAILMPNLNVKNNIEFPLILRDIKPNNNFVNELLNIVGLIDYKDYSPKELSGGMKTRVALARSFITEPELLLLDEPFSALDLAWRFELYKYLISIKEKFSTTIIMVSHDIQEAILLANKIFVLSYNGSEIKTITVKQPDNKKRIFDYKYVNDFLNENMEIFYDIQSDIYRDAERNRTNYEVAEKYVEIINKAIKNKKEEDREIYKMLSSLKAFVNEEKIKKALLSFWKNSEKIRFKQELTWRITEIENIGNTHDEILQYLIDNEDEIKKITDKDDFFQNETIIETTDKRIKSNEYLKQKNWLYVYYLYIKTRGTAKEKEALNYINSIMKKDRFKNDKMIQKVCDYISKKQKI